MAKEGITLNGKEEDDQVEDDKTTWQRRESP